MLIIIANINVSLGWCGMELARFGTGEKKMHFLQLPKVDMEVAKTRERLTSM